MPADMVDLSVIVAVYNEDPRNLARMIDRLSGVLSPLHLSWEVVFVNDGSNPNTSAALRRITAEADNVKLIELSRNFGQQAAITAGLDHADGQAVVNIDSDLQDPPELIPEMIKRWQEGYEVVYAQRATRKDHVAKRLSAHLFYRMLACVSSVEIPWDTGDFRLMDRKVVEALKGLPEKTRFLRGMIPWLGFRQIGIPVDRGARELGESTYTLRKLLMLAMDGLLAFSAAPLYAIPLVGVTIMAAGVVCLLTYLAGGGSWHSLASPQAIWLVLVVVAGLQIACTGLVAVYLARVLDEVRARPTYLVSQRIGLPFARSEDHAFRREAPVGNVER